METLSEETQRKERKRIEISTEIRQIQRFISDEHMIKKELDRMKQPTIEVDKKIEDLLKLYKNKHDDVKQYLPKMKHLLEDGILFVIVSLHGAITELPTNIRIPHSTVFFKAMTSDYGATSCDRYDTNHEESLFYQLKTMISEEILVRKDKGTRRNNIKFMKKTMKNVLNKINTHMDDHKKIKLQNMKELRYLISQGHIHYYEHGGNIVEKEYQIQIDTRDNYDQILVVNKKYKHLNLLDYLNLDIPTTSQQTTIDIRMKDVFKLFKGIKYVFFVDQSCSSLSVHNEFMANKAQTLAEELEGKSFTQNIINYENISPYNRNSVYERQRETEPQFDSNNENNYTNIPPPPPLKKLNNLEKAKLAKIANEEREEKDWRNYKIHEQRKMNRLVHYQKLKKEEEDAELARTAVYRKREAEIIERIKQINREEAKRLEEEHKHEEHKNSPKHEKPKHKNSPKHEKPKHENIPTYDENAHNAAFNRAKLWHNPFWKTQKSSPKQTQTKKWRFW